jgi:hypothetical protein
MASVSRGGAVSEGNQRTDERGGSLIGPAEEGL